MAENALEVELRQGVGKGVARKLRAAGRIPAVLYGKSQAPLPLALDPHALRRLIQKSDAGMNTLISLRAAGQADVDGKPVLIRELQRDPVKGHYLHADLLAVDLRETLEVSVPIHVIGRARGVELGGGILDQALRELELECLPTAIPKEIQLDVSELEIGQSLHVRDIPLPAGVELRSDPDLSVVSVVAPTVAEEEVPAEAALVEGAEAAEGAEPAEQEAAKGEAAGESSGD